LLAVQFYDDVPDLGFSLLGALAYRFPHFFVLLLRGKTRVFCGGFYGFPIGCSPFNFTMMSRISASAFLVRSLTAFHTSSSFSFVEKLVCFAAASTAFRSDARRSILR